MSAILFDLYGTLVDIWTNENTNLFWKRFCSKTRKFKAYDYKTLKRLYCDKCKELEKQYEEIEILDVFSSLFEVDKKYNEKIALLFRRLSRKYYKLYPGVKKLLTELKKNHSVYLLSNAQASFTISELKSLGIYDFFDGVAISSDYRIKKPNEDFFKQAIKNFNITGDIWMIGNDYQCDIIPAKNLNINYIFIKSNLTPKDQFKFDGLNGFDYKKILKTINRC